MLMTMTSHDQESHFVSYFRCLNLMQWCHLLYCWHDVTIMPVPMAPNFQKNNVAPHADHLDPRNAMVPLTQLLASHDARAGAKRVT